MTTIAYKNGILAADTRSTYPSRRGSKAHCATCGTHNDRVDDKFGKIRIGFKDALWKGEKIIAATGSGDSADIDHAITALRNGKDLTAMIEGHLLFSQNQQLDYALFVVTDKHFHVISSEAGKIKLEEKSLDGEYFFGSGGSYARFANDAFNATAVQAIEVAIFADKGTGGQIDSFDTRPGKSKEIVSYKWLGVPAFKKLMGATNPFKTMVHTKLVDESKPKPPAKSKPANDAVAPKPTPVKKAPSKKKPITPPQPKTQIRVRRFKIAEEVV